MAKVDSTWVVWIPPGRAPSWYAPVAADFWPEGVESGDVVIHRGTEPPGQLDMSRTFVAHNAIGFDALAYRNLVGGPQPEWYDTLPCARAAGLPGGLDALGERLTGRGKDAAGAKVMKLLSTAKYNPRTREVEYPLGTDAAWNLLLRYNVLDVHLLEKVYAETNDYGEPDVLQADVAINNRGVEVDCGLAESLKVAWWHAEREASEEIAKITNGVLKAGNIRSVEQVKEWVREQGIDLTSLDKNQVRRLIDSPEELVEDADSDSLERVVEVLKLRQIVTSAAPSKLASLRESVRDGRAVDSLVYYGAHTGRWSGRGVQPQNLGRGSDKVDVEACLERIEAILPPDDLGPTGDAVAEALREVCPGVPLRDVLSTLTRPVFKAKPWHSLVICDYAAIEARGVAWVSGDEKLLDAFRCGRDVYCEMGSVIFGRPITKADKVERQIAKIVVLGCGYGMSSKKFTAFCKSQGVDLEAAGTSGEACVTAYRERHSAIKTQWNCYDAAAKRVVEGKAAHIDEGRCGFAMRGPHLAITLPSGRPILYRNARIEMQVPVYCKMLGLPEVPKPTVMYEHPRGYTKSLYGGLITENVVQAVCRDLLATSIVRCEAEGLPVVLHVHDEIVLEVPSDTAGEFLQRLVRIMTDPPEWASGFPVGVEGFTNPRYAKVCFEGYETAKGESCL